jgi:alpha-galactosidase/6-phospho-beta-glucosidase family protein
MEIDFKKDELKEKLEKEKKSRQSILNETKEELDNHMVSMIKYNKIKDSYHMLTEKYIEEELKRDIVASKIDTYLEKLTKQEQEVQTLTKESEQLKKRITTLKSLLEILIDHYGIENISQISGISVIKLKEYLQD